MSRLVSQGILNVVTKFLDCACGTRSRSSDLQWFNLCLDQIPQGILNLVTKILDCACGTSQVTFTDLDGLTCV